MASSSSSEMIETCSICIDNYNKSTRSEVKCEKCDFKCCRSCVTRYILDSRHEVRCMNCNTNWSRRHLASVFTKSFLQKELKNHYEDLLVEIEKSRLPETLQKMQEEKERQDKYQNFMLDKDKRYMSIKMEKYNLLSQQTESKLKIFLIRQKLDNENLENDEVEKLEQEVIQLKELVEKIIPPKLTELESRKTMIKYEIFAGEKKKEKEEKRVFIKPCPAPDCRGFLSSQWVCGICKVKVCPHCHEMKSQEEQQHTCKPEDVETARLIAKETKPCPKCGVCIQKISGCDQMFCTECQTTFSWAKGTITTGVIHNPHYFEWKKKNGGVDLNNNNNCNDPLNNTQIYCDHIMNIVYNETIQIHSSKKYEYKCNFMIKFSRLLAHTRDGELARFEQAINAENEDLRRSFLRKEFDEIEFKRLVQMKHKNIEKSREFALVLRMFIDVGGDLCRRYKQIYGTLFSYRDESNRYRSHYDKTKVEKVLNDKMIDKALEIHYEVGELSRYVIAQLEEIGEAYNSVALRGFCNEIASFCPDLDLQRKSEKEEKSKLLEEKRKVRAKKIEEKEKAEKESNKDKIIIIEE
jgi:hypothetical protein